MISFLKTKNFYSLGFLLLVFIGIGAALSLTENEFSNLDISRKCQIFGFILIQTPFFLLLTENIDPKNKLSTLPAFFNLFWQFYLIGQGLIPTLIESIMFFIFLVFTLLILSKQKIKKTFIFLLFLILHSISIFTPEWFLMYIFLGLALFFIHQNLQYLILFVFSYLTIVIYWSAIAYLFDHELFFFQEKLIPEKFCIQFNFPVLEKNLFLVSFLGLIGIFHFLSLVLGIGVKSFLQNQKALIFLSFLLFVVVFSGFLQCSFAKQTQGAYILFSLYFAFVWSYLCQNSSQKWLELFWFLGLIFCFFIPFFL